MEQRWPSVIVNKKYTAGAGLDSADLVQSMIVENRDLLESCTFWIVSILRILCLQTNTCIASGENQYQYGMSEPEIHILCLLCR